MSIDFIVSIIVFVIGVVAFIFTFIKSRSIKSAIQAFYDTTDALTSKNLLKEDDSMKYRLPDYSESSPQSAQDFSDSRFKKKYLYDERTGTLVDTGEVIDLQEMIDSFKTTVIEQVLQKIDPSFVADEAPIELDYTHAMDDLADLADLMDSALELKEAYGLDPNLSLQDTYNFISNHATLLKATAASRGPSSTLDKLSTSNDAVSVDSVVNKEVKNG